MVLDREDRPVLSRMPWIVPSNSERWVTSTSAGRPASAIGEAMVLAGDLDLAGGQVLTGWLAP